MSIASDKTVVKECVKKKMLKTIEAVKKNLQL